MGLICKIVGHKWNGCTCIRCRETRDENHDWNGCKCRICWKVRDRNHDFDGCKCRICGGISDWGHVWDPTHDGVETCRYCGGVRRQIRSVPKPDATQEEVVRWAVDELRWLYSGENRQGFVKRSAEAEPVCAVGERLAEAGGFDLMMKAFHQFGGSRNLEMVWDGIGGWAG